MGRGPRRRAGRFPRRRAGPESRVLENRRAADDDLAICERQRPALAKADRVAFSADLHRIGFIDDEYASRMTAEIARSLRGHDLKRAPGEAAAQQGVSFAVFVAFPKHAPENRRGLEDRFDVRNHVVTAVRFGGQ